MIYLITIVMLLIFVLRYDINGKTRYRNECYFVMLVIFILIAGLRYRLGIDTTRYLTRFYSETPKLQDFKWSEWELGLDPLFTLMNSVVLTLGGKFYVVQLVHATFVNTLLFKYIRKHTNAIFISIFIYFIWQYAVINMEEMRASMSLAVCLFANDYMLEKKWLKGILLYVVGCFFHASTILVMVMPLFFFLRFNMLGIYVMAISFIIGFVIQPFIPNYIEFMELSESVENKAERYVNNESFMETRSNILGILLQMIIYLYAIISLWFIKRNMIGSRLTRVEPLLMVFMVLGLTSLGIPILYRYVRFYVIYCIMFVSEFMTFQFRRDSKLRRGVIMVNVLIIMFPFFFQIIKTRSKEGKWVRYHPYSSIFDQELDQRREKLYSSYHGDPPVSGKY